MPAHRHRIYALAKLQKIGEFERPVLHLAKAACQAFIQPTVELSKFVERFNAPPMLIIIAMMAVYLMVGCVMEL